MKFLQKPAVLAAIGVTATLLLTLIVVVALLLTSSARSVSANAALIGALVALGGVFTTQLVNTGLEAQRAHEAALQRYLEQLGNLLIERPEKDTTFSMVARAQTLAVLKGLRGDSDRKRVLMLFLSESHLIDRDNKGLLRLADLSDAHLGGLRGGILGCKNLSETHLEGANLSNTDLCYTDLTEAILKGADLRKAALAGADLAGADLRGVKGSTQEQINVACGDEATKLPGHLRRPAHWRCKGNKEQPKQG